MCAKRFSLYCNGMGKTMVREKTPIPPYEAAQTPDTITKGKSISRSSHSAAQPEAADAPVQLSPRSCVLVVEDEPLVAMEIAQVLEAAGFDVAGPVDSTSAALELLRHERCDAAVLDINLGGETSEAIALELLKSGIPFVTLSGYSHEQYPPAFRNASALMKPLRPELLVAELKHCIAQQCAKAERPIAARA